MDIFKFKKTLLMIAVAALLVPAVLALAAPPPLTDILNKTEDNYKKVQAFNAYFRQKTTSAATGALTPAEASGRLYYAKPHRMRWEYDKPEQQVFVANGDFAWLYVKAENQITFFDAGKLFSSPLAKTFFEGAVGLKEGFDVTLEAGKSTQSTAILKLVPKQEDPNIKTLYLAIDLKGYRISRIESQDILGNTNNVAIESFAPQPSLDQKLFQLDTPPGARVFDVNGRELSATEIQQLKTRISSEK